MWCDFCDKWTKGNEINYKMLYSNNVLLHISLGDILTYYNVCFIVFLYIFMIFDGLQNGNLVLSLITCFGKEEHYTMVVKA
jgi:hypothetical protein